jgi:hypothetical protein
MTDLEPAELLELSETFRKHKPAKLRAVNRDGEAREVACTQGRAARWVQVARTVLAWAADLERVELCDRSGALLQTWRPRAATEAEGDEDLELAGEPELERAPPELRLALSVQALVQRATDHAVDRHLRGMRDVVEGLLSIIKIQDQRNAQLERQTSSTLKLAYEATRMHAQAELPADAGGGSSEVDRMAMALLQGALGGAAAPNGKPPQ